MEQIEEEKAGSPSPRLRRGADKYIEDDSYMAKGLQIDTSKLEISNINEYGFVYDFTDFSDPTPQPPP